MFKTLSLTAILGLAVISLSACEGVKKSSVVKLNTGGITYDVDLTPQVSSDN